MPEKIFRKLRNQECDGNDSIIESRCKEECHWDGSKRHITTKYYCKPVITNGLKNTQGVDIIISHWDGSN